MYRIGLFKRMAQGWRHALRHPDARVRFEARVIAVTAVVILLIMLAWLWFLIKATQTLRTGVF